MVALSLLLGGCGAAESLVGKFGGGGKDEILPGAREAVLTPNAPVASETESSEPVVIPAAVSNTNWTQAGGVASHAMHNLALGSNLQRALDFFEGAACVLVLKRPTTPPIYLTYHTSRRKPGQAIR